MERPEWSHGAFTKALLDTFASPASDLPPQDGRLSVIELEHNLDVRIRQLTSDQQRPVTQKPPTIANFSLFQWPTLDTSE